MRKNFPLRIDEEVLDRVRRWADDDLRSLNGQIEYLLRESLRRTGRLNEAARSEEAQKERGRNDEDTTASSGQEREPEPPSS